MTDHPNHGLKIADTSDDDAADDAASNTLSPTSAVRPDSAKSAPQLPSSVERDMELEIDRVKRLNGVPRLALNTCRDDR
jgi:hypothetical protein